LQVADLAEPRPVCPPGTLARLRQHQIFARLPDGSVTEAPVSLEPLFVDSPDSPNPKREPAPRDDLAVAVQKLREESALQEAPAAPTFLMYMHNRGHRLHLTPNVLGAAWQVCVPTQRHSALLAKARGFHVGGLTQLPGCWLLGLLAWLRRHPTLAPAVLQVTIDCGVLWPTLDAAWTNWGDGPESIPESINLALYPCLWRALKPRHLFEIASQRPDLRAELPQPSTPGKTP
jgi:hypothetical protein